MDDNVITIEPVRQTTANRKGNQMNRKSWMTTEQMNAVDWTSEAIAANASESGWFLVRKTLDGAFAVIHACEGKVAMLFVHTDLSRCRAYASACAR